jgi:DNA-binding response OmpR family regulator
MVGNSKIKILIVEDDEMVRSFVTIHLENHGFDIDGVATGKALFAALEK